MLVICEGFIMQNPGRRSQRYTREDEEMITIHPCTQRAGG